MERVETLIKRLLEQYETRAGKAGLIITAQMLLHELQSADNGDIQKGNKISVIHPAHIYIENKEVVSAPAPEAEKPLQKEEVEKEATLPQIEKEPANTEAPKPFISVPVIEVMPTFAYQQKEIFELNESLPYPAEQTLNDRLKTEKKELGSMLKDSPVKDLKRAIGINDRFVFIDELFRGDENMYERSIKTINSFSIFPEAEYWIQRELKVKIGWDEESSTVKQFDQLVKRRFS